MICIKKYKMLTTYFANLKIKISSIITGIKEEEKKWKLRKNINVYSI